MKGISEIIRQISSSDIENGKPVGYPCDAFAEMVIERMGAGTLRWLDGRRHCVVVLDGRLYDEQNPEGFAPAGKAVQS